MTDMCLGNEVEITPDNIWNGYPDPQKPFKGLKAIINSNNAPAGPYYIVAAQCYGAFFADELGKIVVQQQVAKAVHCIGLSYEPTTSEATAPITVMPNDKVGQDIVFQHLEFYEWMKKKFSNVQQDDNHLVQQAVGMGAILTMSENDVEKLLASFFQ